MIEMPVGIADHNRFIGDRFDKRPKIAVSVSGIDQHRLFLADQQIAVQASMVVDNPRIGESRPLPINIAVFIDVRICHKKHPLKKFTYRSGIYPPVSVIEYHNEILFAIHLLPFFRF